MKLNWDANAKVIWDGQLKKSMLTKPHWHPNPIHIYFLWVKGHLA